jgi:hypothetical protein
VKNLTRAREKLRGCTLNAGALKKLTINELKGLMLTDLHVGQESIPNGSKDKMVSVFLEKSAAANWNGPTGTEGGGSPSAEDGDVQEEEGTSDDEDGSKGHGLVGSCFEDPDDGMCEVTGHGDDGDGDDILFYKLPDGEEVYGAVEEVRALVLAHRGAANKRQRRGN